MESFSTFNKLKELASKHRVDIKFIRNQFLMGLEVEKEHSQNIGIRTKITLDHLNEIPDYYTRLKTMEQQALAENVVTAPDSITIVPFDDIQSGIGRLQVKKGAKYTVNDEGKLHSFNDHPAIKTDAGSNWFRHGLRHRDNGPSIEGTNGRSLWYRDGNLHREDGPAIIDDMSGTETYYSRGKKHRVDGPAVVSPRSQEYWINGKKITKEELDQLLRTVDKENIQDVQELGDLF